MSKARFSYENNALGSNRKLKRQLADHEQWVEAILPADAEARQVETDTNRQPLWFMASIMGMVLVILGIRLFLLQIVDGQHNFSLAEGNRIRQQVTRAPRGVIYDRNHQLLVRNQSNFDVTVVPQQLPRDDKTRQSVYQKVSDAIGISAADITQAVETGCLAAARKAGQTPSQAKLGCLSQLQPILVTSNLDRDKALVFDQRALDFPGFALDVNPVRQYLDDGLLSQVLGYTARVSPDDLKQDATYLPTDYIGKLGIEKQYEDLLRGVNGSQRTEVDVTEKPVKVLASQPTAPGSNLVLSIDKGLEAVMAQAMNNQLQAAQSKGVDAKKASGVALNPKTGEVLALVSLPGYDNNLFARGISQADYSKLANNPAQPLFNKPVSGAYPTGSIIKPLIGSAVLQEHVVTPDTTVNDTGQIEIPNKYDPATKYIFRSYEPGGLGVLNITNAIRQSSNVFFYTVGGGFGNIVGLGVDKLAAYYQKFGLGAKTGIDLPGETAGLVPTPAWKQKAVGEPWYIGDTYNISVGQGDLRASPLQMANAIAAIANGGTVLKPHLVTQVLDDQGKVIKDIKPEVVRQAFISPDNLNIIRNAMRQVVISGTGCCLMEKNVPVHVAGKTGTAETEGYSGASKPHAWFEAYAPYEDPKIVVVIMIENVGEGAQYALPAVRETLTWYFNQPGNK